MEIRILFFASVDGDIKIELPKPMTEEGYQSMIALLELSKPALLKKPDVLKPTIHVV